MIRRLFLWVFITWWIVPIIWTFVFGIGYLIDDFKNTVAVCKYLTAVVSGKKRV